MAVNDNPRQFALTVPAKQFALSATVFGNPLSFVAPALPGAAQDKPEVAQHAFNSAVDSVLGECIGISNDRGGEYQDTWHVDNVVTLFQDRVDRLDGRLDLDREWRRLRTIAALIDVKISRLLGPWKRDTGIDLINYVAAFTQWMDEYDAALEASR